MEFIKIVVLPIAVLAAMAYGATAWQCAGYEDITGKETQMKAGSCFIKDGGAWYAWTEYKYRLATKGEFSK